MLLPVDTAPANMGTLCIRGDTCYVNATMSKLCDPGGEKRQYSSTQMRQLGEVVKATAGEKPIGAWFIDLVAQEPAGVRFARATAANSTVVDALVEKGQVRVAVNTEVSQPRVAEHGLRNRVNGIKMNAELVKILAVKNNLDRLQQAAETIILQCDGLVADDQPSRTGTLTSNANLTESPVDLLRRLHGIQRSSNDKASLVVAMPKSCPRELLMYVSHFLAILRAFQGEDSDIVIESGLDNRVMLHSRSTGDYRLATVFDQLQGSDFEAFSGRSTSTQHLPTSVFAYEISLKKQQFQMIFNLNS